jgi:hypothetical protein
LEREEHAQSQSAAAVSSNNCRLPLPTATKDALPRFTGDNMANRETASWNLGFLTIVHEPAGYLGGFLVTNQWGRPLEFRLSTAVLPNRVQQILYGKTLQPYLCAELIGKTLIDKTTTQVQVLVTDQETVLPLRQQLSIPVGWIKNEDEESTADGPECERHASALLAHAQFPQDQPVLTELEERLGEAFDLAEPFARIREAIGEARKMGVTSRG